MTIAKRIREVDRQMPRASVSLAELTEEQITHAQEICEHFELKFGTLIRRANAVKLAGGQDDFKGCLQEAAQHLVRKSPPKT